MPNEYLEASTHQKKELRNNVNILYSTSYQSLRTNGL